MGIHLPSILGDLDCLLFLMLLAILPWAVQYHWRLCWVTLHLKVSNQDEKPLFIIAEVCFPEWTPEQVQDNARQVFVDQMLGVFETLNARYSPAWFKNRVSIEGLEHLQKAQAESKGALLLGTHSTLLDAGGYICASILNLMSSIAHRTTPCLIC